ncbi:MAG: DNA glycosylase [Armatimonadota bacterium]|nr:DNA glycosylase [Armatimonadota bacterium]
MSRRVPTREAAGRPAPFTHDRRVIIPVGPPYRLDRTLTSGQCFRWTVTGGSAWGVVDGTVAVVEQDARGLAVAWSGPPGDPARLWRHLGADQPLEAVEAVLARDPVLRRLLPLTSGIALMRQDPWECLVSYVISAFNNIPKIRLTIGRLARALGSSIRPAGDAWTFPGPDRLAGARLDVLRACALGYRARSVRALARLVADGEVDLDAIGRLPLTEARAALLELPGVGEKVADCVLLFAFGCTEAFPVDVWVQRAVERWYFGGRAKTPRAIRAWAVGRFGHLAGYAQQHLFAGARLHGVAS